MRGSGVFSAGYAVPLPGQTFAYFILELSSFAMLEKRFSFIQEATSSGE
jgi:hypothetical protein